MGSSFSKIANDPKDHVLYDCIPNDLEKTIRYMRASFYSIDEDGYPVEIHRRSKERIFVREFNNNNYMLERMLEKYDNIVPSQDLYNRAPSEIVIDLLKGSMRNDKIFEHYEKIRDFILILGNDVDKEKNKELIDEYERRMGIQKPSNKLRGATSQANLITSDCTIF